MEINAPHQATDKAKLTAMIEALRTGGELPAVVVWQGQALTGSHRIEAVRLAYKLWSEGAEGWEAAAKPEISVIEASDEDIAAVMDKLSLDTLGETGDWNGLCDCLYQITSDDAVKIAVEDQR